MKRIGIVVVTIFIATTIIGKVLDSYYKKFWSNPFDKLNTVFIDSSYKDIVFLGDSRTHIGINPFYVDSITTLNSYNIGMGGASVNEVYFLTQAWLNKHKVPKLFVFSITGGIILKSNTFFRNPCFYFFYLDNEYNRKTLSDLHYHTSLFRYMPITKYTAFDEYDKTTILRSFIGGRFLTNNGVSYKGFVNNASTNAYMGINNSDSTYKDMNKINNAMHIGLEKLNNLIELVHKNNSKIVFVIPPQINFKLHHRDSISKKIDYKIEEIAKLNNIEIWHFETDSSFKKTYFQDPIHVNIEGSIHLSKKIGYNIKEMIKDSL
jgi:hypothetical protein